jgi:integrase
LLEAELLRHAGRTVGEAISAYYTEKIELGTARRTTCENEQPRVRRVLAAYLDANLTSITPERANAVYRALVGNPTEKTGAPPAAASHRHYLKLTKSFFGWCVSKGYLAKNPFAEVRPVGRANRGKPQLRSEEISRYIAAGIKCYSEHGDTLALAAVMLPMFGLRAGEALSRRVRDIDRGRIWHLHIDRGLDQKESDPLKNENARRVLEIPSILIPHLSRLIDGRSPTEYLFGPSVRTGQRKSNQSLWNAVTKLCEQAGVPRVCPHSMRGFYASAGVASGALPHVVAANMGHSSFTVTAQHYAKPEAIVQAHSARVFEMLDLEQGADALSHLPAEQLMERLPAETLVRIADLVAKRTALLPTRGPDGADGPTEIRTESLPAFSKSANSRQKN